VRAKTNFIPTSPMTTQLNTFVPAVTTKQEPGAFRPATDRVPLPGTVVGRLVRYDANGAAVDFPGNPIGRPLIARATVQLDHTSIGSEVVLLFENGDPARPIVIGLLRPPAQPSKVVAELDGERIALTAEKEISLKCGEASITLTAAGKILIRGTYVLTRSSGANRIKGATVEIN
jgi:hypothetical protein